MWPFSLRLYLALLVPFTKRYYCWSLSICTYHFSDPYISSCLLVYRSEILRADYYYVKMIIIITINDTSPM